MARHAASTRTECVRPAAATVERQSSALEGRKRGSKYSPREQSPVARCDRRRHDQEGEKRPVLNMHTPCTRHAHAMLTPCSHAMHTPEDRGRHTDTAPSTVLLRGAADHDRTSKGLPSALCARAAGSSLECRLRLSIELSVRLTDAVELEAPLQPLARGGLVLELGLAEPREERRLVRVRVRVRVRLGLG